MNLRSLEGCRIQQISAGMDLWLCIQAVHMPMDVNLTHAIAANVTLTQSSLTPTLITALIAFVGGALVASIGAIITYKNNKEMIEANFKITERNLEQERFKIQEKERLEKQKNEFQIINKQQQAYSHLMGIKGVISQSYTSYLQSFIDAGYYNGRSRIVAIQEIDFDNILEIRKKDGNLKAISKLFEENGQIRRGSLEYEGALEEKMRYENLKPQVSKANERFWMIIGLIHVLFSRTKDLNDLINEIKISDKAIEDFSVDVANSFCFFEDRVQYWLWKIPSNEKRNRFYSDRDKDINWLRNTKIDDCNSKIDDLESKIENLLNYLDKEIQRKV